MNQDEIFMSRCLQLALNGLGHAAPNPMVGSIVVHKGRIIGEGYHQECGQAHAEVNAINSVKETELLKESTIYVNLEPCSHWGRTPPCADLIIKHRIPKVVIGCVDSFEQVSGRGIQKLRDADCEVITGVLEKEALELNKRFFTYHQKKRPYIILKLAQTKDGFIDKLRNDASEPAQWITNEHARTLVHKWRTEEMGILVGTNTALKDNPKLNVRSWFGSNPIRIVIDRALRLPENLHLFDQSIPTIVFTEEISPKKSKNIIFQTANLQPDQLDDLLLKLYEQKMQSIIVEGGAELMESFVNQNKWDEARVFIGNRFFGNGVKAPHITDHFDSFEQLDDNDLYIAYNRNPH